MTTETNEPTEPTEPVHRARATPEVRQEFIDRLTVANKRLQASEAKVHIERAVLSEIVREAFAAGVPARPLCDATGYSESRIYQIRDEEAG